MRFPEMLFIDATHKLNELRMPFYVLLGMVKARLCYYC